MYLLVSALLGFMAVSGLLGRGNLAAVAVAVEPPDEIYDGIETLLTVRFANRRRRLPACLLSLELPGGETLCPLLRAGETVTRPLAITFRGRGSHRLGEVRLASTFPINFFRRSIALPPAGEVTVFPAPRRCRPPQAAGATVQRGETAAGQGYEGDLTRIGDYQGGEPLKMIHWKLSARHGALKVKELSAAAATPLLIDPEGLPGAGLEERLRCACWLVQEASRADRPVGLRLPGGALPPASGRHHKLRLLGELARYGRNPHPA